VATFIIRGFYPTGGWPSFFVAKQPPQSGSKAPYVWAKANPATYLAEAHYFDDYMTAVKLTRRLARRPNFRPPGAPRPVFSVHLLDASVRLPQVYPADVIVMAAMLG